MMKMIWQRRETRRCKKDWGITLSPFYKCFLVTINFFSVITDPFLSSKSSRNIIMVQFLVICLGSSLLNQCFMWELYFYNNSVMNRGLCHMMNPLAIKPALLVLFLPYCFWLLLVCCIRRSIWGNSNCLEMLQIFGTCGISKWICNEHWICLNNIRSKLAIDKYICLLFSRGQTELPHLVHQYRYARGDWLVSDWWFQFN
jgi:hypothetical protein